MAATKDELRSEQQALAQLESIREMVERLEHAEKCKGDREDCEITRELPDDSVDLSAFDLHHDNEDARQAIEEDALSVEVRSDWYTPGASDEKRKPGEYYILLSTGGPASRIIGELDGYCQPTSARLQHQDWFTPWQEVIVDHADLGILLRYASVFYFGD